MKKRKAEAGWVYTILLLFSVIVLLLVILFSTDAFDSGYKNHVRTFGGGWILPNGEAANISDLHPRDHGGIVDVKRKLPGVLTDADCLCFESRNANITVYLDDREIYSFTSNENLTGLGYGNAFHQVQLGREDGGHMIRVTFWGVRRGFGRILSAYLAPATDYYQMNVLSRVLPAVISLSIIAIGLTMLIIFLQIPDKENMPFNILSLSMVAVVIGSWLLVDTNLMTLLIGRVYFWRALNRLLVLLVGYPCVSFVNSITEQKRDIYLHLAFLENVLIFCTILGLRFFAGVDMMITFSYGVGVMISLSLILTLVCIIDNELYCRSNGIVSRVRSFYPGMIALIICATLDVALFLIRVMWTDSYGIFSRFGLALFVLMSLVQFLRWWTRDRKTIARDRFINRALQYTVSSNSSEESIRSMLDFMGKELHAGRIGIFEEQGNGKYRGTYEWFPEGGCSAGLDLIYLPYEGMVEDLRKTFDANNHNLIINDPEDYRLIHPSLYNLLMANHIKSIVAGPLESKGRLLGVLTFLDVPAEVREETAEIITLISYFLTQLINQREEQKRLRRYSYMDSLTGAQNRRAFNEYIRDGLDLSSAFGYITCNLKGLEETNRKKGYEAGDRMVVSVVDCLKEVFGEGKVYRMSGSEFSAFGFETDETFFHADVQRVVRLMHEKELQVDTGSVFCAFGSMGMERVINQVHAQMREAR
ncbi:MAG: diguanylate cyclase [Lachnospiraceae bacterium]|nr:diguanylate cyclase [Lachnospiraceae bacterium]